MHGVHQETPVVHVAGKLNMQCVKNLERGLKMVFHLVESSGIRPCDEGEVAVIVRVQPSGSGILGRSSYNLRSRLEGQTEGCLLLRGRKQLSYFVVKARRWQLVFHIGRKFLSKLVAMGQSAE